jgi:hypothetical protein
MNAIARAARRIGSAAVTAVQIASLTHEPEPSQPATCECGRPVRNDRADTCWQCRFENDNHESTYADEEAS